MKELTGRHALVTGGSRGIGAAIVECFFREGASVTVLGKSQSTSDKLPFIQCDLSSAKDTADACKKIKELKVDILINNAGINKIGVAHEADIEDWERVQAVNVRAPFLLSQACLPHMLERKWGRIVGISSVFGSITRSGRVSYSTSKAALNGMTRSLAVDYAAKGVLANTVSPGFIDTDLTRKILTSSEIDDLCRQVPMLRLGKPAEIAEMVLFLSSDRNSFMTGQNVVVDGGFSVV